MASELTWAKILVTVTTAGTEVQVNSTDLFVTDFELYVPTTNTGSVYIGPLGVDNTWIPRVKGQIYSFTSGTGDLDMDAGFNLKKVYIDAGTNGDTAIIQYRLRGAF